MTAFSWKIPLSISLFSFLTPSMNFLATASTFSYSEKSALFLYILKDIIIFIVKLNLII